MGNLHGRMPTKGESYKEHDRVEERQRVATHIDGNTASYEDTNFTSAETLSVLNVLSDLGRSGHQGTFINDGPGEILVEISFDGATYGGLHTLKGGEQMALSDLKIAKIRLTYVDPTAYRCMVG